MRCFSPGSRCRSDPQRGLHGRLNPRWIRSRALANRHSDAGRPAVRRGRPRQRVPAARRCAATSTPTAPPASAITARSNASSASAAAVEQQQSSAATAAGAYRGPAYVANRSARGANSDPGAGRTGQITRTETSMRGGFGSFGRAMRRGQLGRAMRRETLTPRPDWRAKVEALGLDFHTTDGRALLVGGGVLCLLRRRDRFDRGSHRRPAPALPRSGRSAGRRRRSRPPRHSRAVLGMGRRSRGGAATPTSTAASTSPSPAAIRRKCSNTTPIRRPRCSRPRSCNGTGSRR